MAGVVHAHGMRAGIEITVTPEDRRRLEVIARDRNAAQKHVPRAKVILATAGGCGTMEITRRSGLSRKRSKGAVVKMEAAEDRLPWTREAAAQAIGSATGLHVERLFARADHVD